MATCDMVVGWLAGPRDGEPGDEIECGAPLAFGHQCFKHAEETYRMGDSFPADEQRRYRWARLWHITRRGAWHVRETLLAAALAPVLLTTLVLPKEGGSGLGPAIAMFALAGIVTLPIWVPFALAAKIVGMLFNTDPIGAEMDAEDKARRKEQASRDARGAYKRTASVVM